MASEQGQGLIYEDLLPLRWQALASEVSAEDISKLEEENEEVLRVIDVLDEYPSEAMVEHSSISQELARVEIKFDLLLSLVSQLLGVYFPLPAPVRAKLTPWGIQWISNEELNVASYGLVHVYLSNRFPRPIVVPSQVDHVNKEREGYKVTVQFSKLSDTIRQRLEKMIFRHHRRRVAQARRRVTTDLRIPSH